jgi:hypothetical protein
MPRNFVKIRFEDTEGYCERDELQWDVGKDKKRLKGLDNPWVGSGIDVADEKLLPVAADPAIV